MLPSDRSYNVIRHSTPSRFKDRPAVVVPKALQIKSLYALRRRRRWDARRTPALAYPQLEKKVTLDLNLNSLT